MSTVRRVASFVAESAGRRVAASRLRVLAYHRVTDRDAFARQLDHLKGTYVPVDVNDVLAAVERRVELPRRAVWVTFDDGYRDAADAADLLHAAGIRATLFVCPTAAEGDVLWFERARAALDAGWRPAARPTGDVDDVMRWLKGMVDAERRAVVATLPPWTGPSPFASRDDLGRWVDLGQHVGNHTWDHPCLDQCPPEEIVHQVRAAREWIDRELPSQPPVFAYPNGDWSPPAAAAVARTGERLALLFDHRLATAGEVQVSRLRMDAGAPVDRLRLVLSGMHRTVIRVRHGRVAGRR